MIGEETLQPIGQPLGKSSSNKLSHGSSSNLELSSHGNEETTEFRIKASDKSGHKPVSLWHVSVVSLLSLHALSPHRKDCDLNFGFSDHCFRQRDDRM